MQAAQLHPFVSVISSGTHAHVGWSADDRSARAAAKHGYDLSKHRARQLHKQDYKDCHLLVALDSGMHSAGLLLTFCAAATGRACHTIKRVSTHAQRQHFPATIVRRVAGHYRHMHSHADAAHKHKIVLLNWFAAAAPEAKPPKAAASASKRRELGRGHPAPLDVPDPYYEEDEVFDDVFDMVDVATDGLVEVVRAAVFGDGGGGSGGGGTGAGAAPRSASTTDADPVDSLRRLVEPLRREP